MKTVVFFLSLWTAAAFGESFELCKLAPVQKWGASEKYIPGARYVYNEGGTIDRYEDGVLKEHSQNLVADIVYPLYRKQTAEEFTIRNGADWIIIPWPWTFKTNLMNAPRFSFRDNDTIETFIFYGIDGAAYFHIVKNSGRIVKRLTRVEPNGRMNRAAFNCE